MFSLKSLFKSNPDTDTARILYGETIHAARRHDFFSAMGVPDTPEGRFEILSLMAFLVLRRLKTEPEAKDVSQAFFDVMFDDIDANLRELGVGDISVGKKVKKLAESFYGRIKAYEEALAVEGNDQLCHALTRYPYRNTDPVHGNITRLAAHVRTEDAHLAAQGTEDLLSAKISFAAIAPAHEESRA